MGLHNSFSGDISEQINAGFFDRHGGVGLGPYLSCNVSSYVGDDLSHVMENRSLVKKKLGIDLLFSSRQVHGDKVYHLGNRPDKDCEVSGYDAMITNLKGVGLLIQQADCQAVLLYDPVKGAIGAIHNGWKGSVSNIVLKCMEAMAEVYGSRPGDLHAAVSPSLGPCCAEFINYGAELPNEMHSFQLRKNYFDFWQITREQLMAGGISKANIDIAGVCTSCSSDYFSYRRSKRQNQAETGRNCSVIALR